MKVRHRLIRKANWIACKGRIRLEGFLGRLRRMSSGNFKSQAILFYPDKLTVFTAAWKICQLLNCRPVNTPDTNFNLALYWDGREIRSPDVVLSGIAASTPVINLKCCDFSKATVARVFASTFGYELSVDPRAHEGVCLKKSDRNGTHDGEAMNCPIPELERGYVYQKLINNEVGDGLVCDLRVPVFKNSIPFVYLKYRKKSSRYSNLNDYAEVADTAAQLTPDEVLKTLSFCRAMGMDYGELDVLRDKDDKRIYIVDVNPTPFGPPNHINRRHRKVALKKLAEAFEQNFIRATH